MCLDWNMDIRILKRECLLSNNICNILIKYVLKEGIIALQIIFDIAVAIYNDSSIDFSTVYIETWKQQISQECIAWFIGKIITVWAYPVYLGPYPVMSWTC